MLCTMSLGRFRSFLIQLYSDHLISFWALCWNLLFLEFITVGFFCALCNKFPYLMWKSDGAFLNLGTFLSTRKLTRILWNFWSHTLVLHFVHLSKNTESFLVRCQQICMSSTLALKVMCIIMLLLVRPVQFRCDSLLVFFFTFPYRLVVFTGAQVLHCVPQVAVTF